MSNKAIEHGHLLCMFKTHSVDLETLVITGGKMYKVVNTDLSQLGFISLVDGILIIGFLQSALPPISVVPANQDLSLCSVSPCSADFTSKVITCFAISAESQN